MNNIHSQQHTSQTGFALLLTLVIVSVVLSIGLSLLDITLKQLVLSGTARDSEIAFHAAYAGLECAEYWVRDDYEVFKTSPPSNLRDCVGVDLALQSTDNGTSYVYQLEYENTWGTGDDQRCTNVEVYILDAAESADADDGEVTYNNFTSLGSESKTCRAGGICTYIFSRGYNRSCEDIGSLQTVQREVVSEF